MKKSQRSHAIRIYRVTGKIAEVAVRLQLRTGEVQAYLETLPGYPDPNQIRNRRRLLTSEKASMAQIPAPTVTLKRVTFLERRFDWEHAR